MQNAGNSYNVSLAVGTTAATALTAINTALAGSGIYAVKGTNGTDVNFQSTSAFSVVENTVAGGGGAFSAVGSQAVSAASTTASSTGSAIAALGFLSTAVQNLGLVQGRVGAGENKLTYAVNLASSQIANFSAAQSRIRDADTAAEAANLTKAQVLQQSSIAALAQANAAPQAILSLLKG